MIQKIILIAFYIISYISAVTLIVYGFCTSNDKMADLGVQIIICFTPPFLIFLFYKKDKKK